MIVMLLMIKSMLELDNELESMNTKMTQRSNIDL